MKKFIIITNILIILAFGLNTKTVNADENTIELSKNALQETSYAYYRKSKNIQYNSYMKTYSLSPEDITNQNMAYFVCSAYVRTVYKQALGVELPPTSTTITAYAKYLNDKALEEKVDPSTKGIIFFSENFSTEKNMSTTEGQKSFHKELLSKLQVGDVIVYNTGTTGHVLIIYEIQYDNAGNPVEALILNSTSNFEEGFSKVKSSLSYLNKLNDSTGIIEGSIQINNLTNIVKYSKTKKYFALIRPVLNDGTYYKGTVVSGDDVSNCKFSSMKKENVNISNSARDRLKYKGIEINKTVDVFNKSVVNLGDELVYSITIKNNSSETYSDLNVTENISDYVSVIDKNGAILDKNKLSWVVNVEANSTKTITYKVKVNKNTDNLNKTIVSTGNINNLSTGTIKNYISHNLTEKEKNLIKEKYNELKNNYSGTDLINKIYEKTLNINLNLADLKFSELLTLKNSAGKNGISLNTENNYSKYILSNYYGALYNDGTSYIIRQYESYDNQPRTERADYIYSNHFQTGDILIYNNSNDPTVNEDGTYAYIYIDGKFYSGIKDSNELTYPSNSTPVSANGNDSMQTLLGKDYYVILRPSIMYGSVQDTDTKEDTLISEIIENIPNTGATIIYFVLASLVLVSIGFIILKKSKKA